MTQEQAPGSAAAGAELDDEGPQVGLLDVLTWLGQDKWRVAGVTALAAVASLGYALSLPPVYTARTSLLPPSSQQQSSSAAALAALGSLGGLTAGIGGKTPDELYVALLRSDSVMGALDERFDLKKRYDVKTREALRKALPRFVRIATEKKSGVIGIEVDDEDPKFAADLANAHLGAVGDLLDRLAVSEAQQRRVFFEGQLRDTKDNLVKAEAALRQVQEKSGVIVLDKQAESLIASAARVRGLIAEREIQLKVMRTGATAQNPDVIRLESEIAALRAELSRMESSKGGGSAVDMPVGVLPAVAIDHVRARREMKLQEALLEAMLRQYEAAKLDEAKEGSLLQQIDRALPPDHKSKPSRASITLGGMLLGLLCAVAWSLLRHYLKLAQQHDAASAVAWRSFRQAWRLRT